MRLCSSNVGLSSAACHDFAGDELSLGINDHLHDFPVKRAYAAAALTLTRYSRREYIKVPLINSVRQQTHLQ